MSRRHLFSSVLLIYLALFLNLGPAWHRAHGFGLHEADSVVACDCGIAHVKQRQLDDSSEGVISSPACDCSLCHFFKYCQFDYQAETSVFYIERSINKAEAFFTASSASEVVRRARAPPLV